MKADISNLQVGQSPTPIASAPKAAPTSPSAPAPIAPVTPTVPAISAPPTPGAGSRVLRLLIYAGIGLVGMFALIMLVLQLTSGNGEETPSPSPSVSAQPSLSPISKDLRVYFGNPQATIDMPDNGTALTVFKGAVATATPALQQGVVVGVTRNSQPVTSSVFATTIDSAVPTPLTGTLSADWAAIVYGQSEVFGSTGTPSTATTPSNRLVLAFGLTDATTALQGMQGWETSGFASVSASVFDLDLSKRMVLGFSDGIYRQVLVRYWNFPYADRSIDYAIVLASNGKHYLVMSGSRESLFWAIDQLMQ